MVAEKTDHVSLIAVKRHIGPGLIAAGGDILVVIPTQVPDVAQEIALRILRNGPAEVRPDAPIHQTGVLLAVSSDGQAAEQHKASTPLQLVQRIGQNVRQVRQDEVVLSDVRDRQAACAHALDGAFEFVDLFFRQRMDPFAGPGHVTALPRAAGQERLNFDVRHGGHLGRD